MGLALPPLRSSALPTGILSSAFCLWSDHFFVGPHPATPNNTKKGRLPATSCVIGAGNGIRTHDINLGKVALYP